MSQNIPEKVKVLMIAVIIGMITAIIGLSIAIYIEVSRREDTIPIPQQEITLDEVEETTKGTAYKIKALLKILYNPTDEQQYNEAISSIGELMTDGCKRMFNSEVTDYKELINGNSSITVYIQEAQVGLRENQSDKAIRILAEVIIVDDDILFIEFRVGNDGLIVDYEIWKWEL